MKKEIIIICAIVLFTAGSASAAITVYSNNRPGWESAVGVYEEEFFTDATLNPGVSVVSDFPGYVNTTKGVWWDRLVCPDDGLTTTTWQFDTPIIGYGGNWNPGVPGGPGAHIAVAINGSWISIGEIPSTYTGQFWGFVSTEPFSAVRLSPGSNCSGAWCETYEINSMVYAISEPSIEKSFTDTTLFETFLAQKAVLNDVTVSGDFNSTLDFTDFQIVSITTGSFAGKGFSKGKLETTLEGTHYVGDWQGVIFDKPVEGKLYLKGSISGEISATVEGYLTETVPGSGSYDQYQATWRIGRLGSTITSATIDINGTVSYQSSSEFPAVELYVLQTNIEGTISGHYSGNLSIIITHLRVTEEPNPYCGEGFSIISYVSESGSGQGWTYDNLVSPGSVRLKGLSDDPLFGIVTATLDESELPRTLFLNIERVDLGLPPAPDLKVKTWGPGRVSPGQTINYITEYRNDGLQAAQDVVVVMKLPLTAEYVSMTDSGSYNRESHEVVWHFENISPKGIGYVSTRETIVWGLSEGTVIDHIVTIPKEEIEIPIDSTVGITSEILEETENLVRMTGNISNYSDSGSFYLEVSLTTVTEEIEPVLDITKTLDAVEFNWKFTVEGNSTDLVEISSEMFDKAVDISETWTEIKDAKKAEKEHQSYLEWLRDENLICQETYENYKSWNEFRPKVPFIRWLIRWTPVGWIEKFFPKGTPLGSIYANAVLWNEIKLTLIMKQASGEIPWDIDSLDKLYVFYRSEGSYDVSSTRSGVTTARDPNIKYGPEGNVLPGQQLDYKVEYENEGEGIAFGVYFTDILDEDLDDATLEIGPVIDVETGAQIAPPGIYNLSTRTITWFVGEVGPGDGGYADLSVNIRSDAPEGTDVINYATVYFPSVPEITRTNAVVSVILMNRPPIATAGPDQTVECSSPEGAQVTLDGTGSNDPDNDPLTFTWRENGNIIAGPTTDSISTVTLALGAYAIELTVDDGLGETDTDEVVINVVDTTPPAITVLLIPQEKKLYQVYCSVSDICDPNPQVLSMDINGISVSNGQLVELEAGDEFIHEMKKDLLIIEGDRLILTCTAQDASDNIGEALTTPIVTARTQGFWKNQFANILSGQGATRETRDNLIGYLNTILDDYDVFDEIIEEAVDESNFETIFGNVLALLDAVGDSMRPMAEVQTMALLLNIASDRLALTTIVSTDDFILDALNFILPVLSNIASSPTELEQAKDIADGLNQAILFDDLDLIPGGTFMPPLVKPDSGQEPEAAMEIPSGFALMQNYPNPFNPTTQISFNLARDSDVRLDIYNILGQIVATLIDEHLLAGSHIIQWDGRNAAGRALPSGVYFYRLTARDFAESKKMILMK